VLSALHRQWALLGLRGFSPAELDRARWAVARRYDLRFVSNRDVALELVEAQRLGWGVESLGQIPDLLLALTPADLKHAAAQCKADAAIVIEGDEAIAKAALAKVWP
jgi:predicted Zn-dependent peptidase